MITNIVPVEHKELGMGFMITEENFVNLEEFKKIMENWQKDTH